MSEMRRHWSLDPEVTYLSHGSFGACPIRVLDAQQEIQRRLERQPEDFFMRSMEGELDAARASVAGLADCDASDLVFVPNATTGVNAVLRSFELRAGDELLTTNHAYNACKNALDFVAERAGARVVVADVPFPLSDEAQVVEAVVAHTTDRTRLALLDHITSPTGIVLPVRSLVRELRARGVRTLIDAAHALGHIEVSLRELDPDYYTSNCHKWLCSPKGAAVLYVRRALQPEVRPVVISHGANSMRGDRSRFLQEFDWPGTHDPSAYLAVPHAIELMGGLLPGGWRALIAHNHALALEARRLLCAHLNVEPPAPESMIGNLATVPLPDAGGRATGAPVIPDPLHESLRDRYGIEVPVFAWPTPERRWLRVSAQIYNQTADYERLIAALTELL